LGVGETGHLVEEGHEKVGRSNEGAKKTAGFCGFLKKGQKMSLNGDSREQGGGRSKRKILGPKTTQTGGDYSIGRARLEKRKERPRKGGAYKE